MEFKNDVLGARFVVPDRITVRQQLAYFSAATNRPSAEFMEQLWNAAKPLISEWQCEHLPDKDADLDAIENPKAADVIIWAALEVKKHIQALDEIPKN